MERLVKKFGVFALGLVASFAISCTAIEEPIMNESVVATASESNTKAQANDQKTADLEVFFRNPYEDITIVLKSVKYCVPDNIGGVEETILLDEETVLSEELNLISKFTVKASTVFSNVHVEIIYDAYQKTNNCCIAEDDIIEGNFEYDALGNRIRKWEDGNTYQYVFSPSFVEITFNPSVGNWDNN